MKLGEITRNKESAGVKIKLGQDRDKEGKLFGKNAVELFPITLADGTVLNEGDVLWLNDPREKVRRRIGQTYDGVLYTEEQANIRISKIPDFVRFDVEVTTISELQAKEAKGA